MLGTVLATFAGLIHLFREGVPEAAWLIQPLLLAAFVTPAMLAAEFTRRWLFQIARADLVALFAFVYFCILVGSAMIATPPWPRPKPGTSTEHRSRDDHGQHAPHRAAELPVRRRAGHRRHADCL